MPAILTTTEQQCNALAQTIDVSAYQGLFSKVQFYTGIDNENKKAPCVICAATEVVPVSENPNLGWWNVRLNIIVKERARNTDTSTTLADTIFRGFLVDNIETLLSNGSINYLVKGVWVENQTNSEEGKMWVQALTLMINCAFTA